MSNKKEVEGIEQEEIIQDTLKTCFVIMPISDPVGYDPGHFKRVYNFIIKPACKLAGFKAVRADEIKSTNVIVIDIIRRIIDSDMALCDLSSKNPNVLYELGIRQSFDLPVSFIKDDLTDRIFDIQGFRDTPYSSSLRIDEVNLAINSIATSIKETYENKGTEVNSIVELLGINKAVLKETVNLSSETGLLLDAISDIRQSINSLSQGYPSITPSSSFTSPSNSAFWQLNPDFEDIVQSNLKIGDVVEHRKFGTGVVRSIKTSGKDKSATIFFNAAGERILLLSYANLKRKVNQKPNSEEP